METIKLRHEALKKALLSLQKGLNVFNKKQLKEDQEEYLMVRDGLIQRFEYCIDSFWKFIKWYLEEVDGASVETTRPKEILRLALGGIINAEEHEILTDAISERNLTSHSYNENLATKIQEHIPAYLDVMQAITDRLKIE